MKGLLVYSSIPLITSFFFISSDVNQTFILYENKSNTSFQGKYIYKRQFGDSSRILISNNGCAGMTRDN